MAARAIALVVSCEHGGNAVPAAYRACFADAAAQGALASHRGYDAGALAMARTLARAFRAPLVASRVSRLVVDLNRSARHPRVFSEWMRALPPEARERAIARWWHPHRNAVDAAIRAYVEVGAAVVHVGSHSFTPVLDGAVREVDVGLLYDPSRALERAVVEAWQRVLAGRLPGLSIRRNAPYRGTSDGLTTALRARFADRDYAGIELEVNQRLVADAASFATLRAQVAAALRDALAAVAPSAGTRRRGSLGQRVGTRRAKEDGRVATR